LSPGLLTVKVTLVRFQPALLGAGVSEVLTLGGVASYLIVACRGAVLPATSWQLPVRVLELVSGPL
jgi:hypothetical protein